MISDTSESASRRWLFLFAAWLVAVAASLGALFIGEVLGQTPCNLCWHQRAFMFPLAIILTIASYREDVDVWRYTAPLASIGGLIAAFHSLLYAGLIPQAIEPCGLVPTCKSADMTIGGLIPLPYLSFLAFLGIMVFLILSRNRSTQ